MSRFLRLCLPVLMMISLVSCLKEKSVDSTEGSGAGILRMKIDGKQWSANITAAASIMNGYISIMGSSQDNIDLLISLNTTTAGVYQLDQASDHVAIVLDNNEPSPVGYSTDQGANSSVAGGTVTVTKIDETTKKISGTFSLKVYRSTDDKSLMLTEGVFENLSYTADPPTSGGNNMKFKADGAEIVLTQVEGIVSAGFLSIIGADANATHMLSISVPATITPGDYLFNAQSFYTGTLIKNGSVVYGAEDGGSIKITEHQNNTIKGTFSFTGKAATPPDVAITEGSFSITY